MPRRTTGDSKTSNARINRQTIRLYWQQIRRYKISFFAMLVCIPLSSLLLDTVLPYVLSQAVDTFTSRDAETLWQLLGLAGIVASVGVALNFTGFQSYITHESKVRANLAISTLDTLLKKDAGFFANQKIGALTGRFIDFVNAHVGLQDLLIIRTLTFAFNMVVGTVLIFISI